MPAQRSLLLIVFFLFFFEPGLAQWIGSGADNWLRPYFIWLSVIALVWISQRWSDKREL
jgi:hypothetical protein